MANETMTPESNTPELNTSINNGPGELVLDPKHPGINDADYVARRKLFFDTSRRHRLAKLAPPEIEYSEEEHNIWRYIYAKLDAAHQTKAWSVYLAGKQALGLDVAHMPQLNSLSERLQQEHGISLLPAEGLLDTRDFHAHLYQGIMPCTQFIRHASNPEYTPEPDAVHDVLGHLPALMDKEYGELTSLIGHGVNLSKDEQLQAWDRIYWFTIEFGLIEEDGELKAFGAGLLSSFGEMEYCFSEQVERRPLSIAQIVKTDYDPTQMQNVLFVIPSLAELRRQIEAFIKTL